jgi:PST family polysaccharide transporter
MDSFTITAILSRKMTIIDAMKTKGIYDRGLPLIQASLFFVTPIISVYLPHTNKETNKLGYGKLLEIIFSLALPATIGLIFVLRQVNRLLFNSNALSNVIQLSVTAIVLYAVMLTLTAIKQKGSKPTLIFMVAILLKLIFNLIFIDLFGIIGASVATVIALLFMVICLFIIYKKYMTLSTMNISKIIVSSSTMALFLYYSQFHWFLNLLFVRILLGLLVYIFVAFIINLFQIRTIISQRRQRFEKEA